jgi:predicted outer membrane repeat protein
LKGIGSSNIFTMQSNASVSGNTASDDGGGVYAHNAHSSITLIMQGNASVSDNTSNRNGGGVASNDNIFTLRENATIFGNTANYGGGVIFYGGKIIIEGGTISGNVAKTSGGGIYLNGGTLTKTSGNLYGYDAPLNLANRSASGNAIYDNKGGRWRNISAGSTMNSVTYGFWLNDEVEFNFPSEFIGTWKRANFNNTLTFTEKNITISSNSYTYELLGISGDSYSMKRSSANPFTLAFKLTSGNLVISGDSGNGQDNWNGTWIKQ